MPLPCDIAETPAFPNSWRSAAWVRPSLAATVNPGDEDDDDGNIEPEDDESMGEDEDDDEDDDEEPLWALRCCNAPIPRRSGQRSYCAVKRA